MPCPDARVHARTAYVRNGVVIIGSGGERDFSGLRFSVMMHKTAVEIFLSTGRRYLGCHRKNCLAPLEIGSYADIASS